MHDFHAKPVPERTSLITDALYDPQRKTGAIPPDIGMMLSLLTNFCPDNASCSVNQCDHFTHMSKALCEEAARSICWYLKGTKDKDMILQPFSRLNTDCYIDTSYAGQWKVEIIKLLYA